MRRRQRAPHEQPSLVPMADMLTNTVGIMIFVLILASLSTGGVVMLKHLPIEKPTNNRPVIMYCSAGRMVRLDTEQISDHLRKGLGQPTYGNAETWARRFSARTMETDQIQVTADADVEYSGDFFTGSLRINQSFEVKIKDNKGQDLKSLQAEGSEFRTLLTDKKTNRDFFYFLVDPDCIAIFNAARKMAETSGFEVGWTPMGAGEPAIFGNNGRQAQKQ